MADNADWMSTTVIVRSNMTDGSARVDDDRTHYLVVVEGREKGRRIEFGEKHLVIGRVKPADIVLANLTGGMLTSSAGAIAPLVRPGGQLILSGFDHTEVDGVVAAFASFSEQRRLSEDSWIALELIRHS